MFDWQFVQQRKLHSPIVVFGERNVNYEEKCANDVHDPWQIKIK